MKAGAGAALAAVVVAGCASTSTSLEGRTPFGGTWTVLSLEGRVIDERTRAPGLQFTAGGALQAVTRCSETTLTVVLSPPDGISFHSPTEAGDPGPCDPMDQAIDASLRAVLLDVKRFAGGLPGDRLTLSGASGEVVLAQPAANPTFCAGC
jgi:hypothetical protein